MTSNNRQRIRSTASDISRDLSAQFQHLHPPTLGRIRILFEIREPTGYSASQNSSLELDRSPSTLHQADLRSPQTQQALVKGSNDAALFGKWRK